MNKIPLTLSIVIPVYNEEDYLAGCLDAIAKQSESPDEVIVVDNNSTDDTVAIARKYPWVTLVREPEQGLYFSRNTGMGAAKGDILARIDADTQLDIDWVSNVKRTFEDDSIIVVTGPLGYHDMPFPRYTQWFEGILLRIAMIGGYKFIFGANMAIRKADWQNIVSELCNKPFLFEDIDLAMHLQKYEIYPKYHSKIRGLVSARRLADSPLAFMRYSLGHARTFAFHGRRSPGAYYATATLWVVYVLNKPIFMTFDPYLRRPSLKRLFNNPPARPDPMDFKGLTKKSNDPVSLK